MSGRKKKTDDGTQPFNNPFRDGLKRVRKKIRDARATSHPPVDANASAKTSAPEEADDEVPALPEELFQRAATGARPLATGGRRVAPRFAGDAPKVGSHGRETFDPTADEHFDVRFSDQYIRGRAQGVSLETVEKLARGEFAVRSHVDLHGMAFDHAREAVDEFIARCRAKGERCGLVITGKGRNSPGQIGVLREGIPEWLAKGPSARFVLAFVTARPCDGGEGAIYVLLRRHASRKTRIEVETGGGA